MKHHIIYFILFGLGLELSVSAPSKSRTKNLPQTVYDQKQTGDYNIQLHLKDFQIIALLSDESLGGLGDYDYNYDYSDFTVKPNNSTQKPTESTTPAILVSTTTPVSAPQEQVDPVLKPKPTEKEPESGTNSPDRIKVQIIESPQVHGIVPNDEISHDVPALGEILHYNKRCASGYSRDKKGRCRRTRRPANPFDISRLASSFASRFRSSHAALEKPEKVQDQAEDASDEAGEETK